MTALPEAPARDFTALFDPRTVAVVGASNDQSKYGNWISVQALRMHGRRRVYLVNRRGETVLGQRSYRALADLPEPADLAVIAVPAAGFEQAVDDALAAGTRAIIGISAGFAELGAQGRSRQAAIAERVRAAGAMLLGPNCLGVLDSTTGLFLVSNPLPSGTIGLISQSGNMALELSKLLEQRGLGLSRFASLGNQADLNAADMVRAYTAHPGTELIALYCEDFGDGQEFVRAAAAAVTAGKPVVLLAVGGSQAARRGAASHTGALTSDSAVIDAACRAAGIDRVTCPREMADLLAARYCYGRAPARRVAVLADGGGHAAVASDVAEAHGLHVPPFDERLRSALRAELTPSAGVANPVDLAGAGEQDITSFARTLRLLLESPDTDAVLMTGYFGGYGDYGGALRAAEIDTARAMAGCVRSIGKPVVVHTMCTDSPAAGELRRGGVMTFADVDAAARTLALLARGAERRATPPPPPVPAAPPVRGDGYWAARELLRVGGLRFPAARLAASAGEAARVAGEIGYPVAVKALGLLHKSDAGGVALGLSGPEEVRAAVTGMAERLSPPGYCVERMADTGAGVELIVGVRRDARFGPVAMVGLGGIFTEVLRDAAFALAPVDEDGARDLLLALRGAAVLRGIRGRPPADLAAAARAIATITAIAAAHPEIRELEVNPLLASPAGCLGLDARIVLDTQP